MDEIIPKNRDQRVEIKNLKKFSCNPFPNLRATKHCVWVSTSGFLGFCVHK